MRMKCEESGPNPSHPRRPGRNHTGVVEKFPENPRWLRQHPLPHRPLLAPTVGLGYTRPIVVRRDMAWKYSLVGRR
jgi:hypothetical protein